MELGPYKLAQLLVLSGRRLKSKSHANWWPP